jgi:hypothetical protein
MRQFASQHECTTQTIPTPQYSTFNARDVDEKFWNGFGYSILIPMKLSLSPYTLGGRAARVREVTGRTSTFSKSVPDGKRMRRRPSPAVADAQEEAGAGRPGSKKMGLRRPMGLSVRKGPSIGIFRPRRPTSLGSYGGHHQPTKPEYRGKIHGLKTAYPHS